MNAPLYTTDILRLAASLSAPSLLDRVDGQAELRSPTCGSRVATSVQLDAEGRIAAISQNVHACAFGQASAALVEAKAPGLDLSETKAMLCLLERWLADDGDDISDWPTLSALAPARNRPARHGAILLPLRTLIAAMDAAA